jgi:hypothetical protein
LSDPVEDLNATREDVISDAGRLVEIKREKGRLVPKDPRVRKLSNEAEQIAHRIRSKTVAERELADAIRRRTADGR